MAGNSQVSTVGTLGDTINPFKDNKDGKIGGEIGHIWGFLTQWAHSPNQPELKSSKPPPTQGEVNNQVLQSQLERERQTYMSNQSLPGGGGILETPTTASRTLLGS